ncbi:MAG: ROK family protein [Flavobacteriaceae bacterium]|nr:ROK family protein [Flavobacteriaceae bacterium]
MKSYIGIDLGGTSVKGGRIKANSLEASGISPIPPNENTNEIFERICSLIDTLWCNKIAGIGVAVPALIDFETGTIYGLSNIKQLNGFPIQAALQDKYKVPVKLQNDANCFVLGEKHFGHAKEYQNIVGLITGTGVGSGIIINNELYNGTNMGAGEFGMIPYKDDCFESYCSGKFFMNQYQTAGEKLCNLASAGNKNALKAFHNYGQHMGELIKLICYTLDPQAIIIGGSVVNAFDLYRSSMEESLESFFFQPKLKTKIIASRLNQIAIYGAASLFFENKAFHGESLK